MTNLELLDKAAEETTKARARAVKILVYANTKRDEKEKAALVSVSNLICEQAYLNDDLCTLIQELRTELKNSSQKC